MTSSRTTGLPLGFDVTPHHVSETSTVGAWRGTWRPRICLAAPVELGDPDTRPDVTNPLWVGNECFSTERAARTVAREHLKACVGAMLNAAQPEPQVAHYSVESAELVRRVTVTGNELLTQLQFRGFPSNARTTFELHLNALVRHWLDHGYSAASELTVFTVTQQHLELLDSASNDGGEVEIVTQILLQHARTGISPGLYIQRRGCWRRAPEEC